MANPEYSLIPDTVILQMLFLANNVSKMKRNTELGSRIIEVHNGSSLFTGNAGSGSSNLRRFIIENDLLEAIIALPENMFYNTGIATYLWVVTNKKDKKRKGKVQLIDATSLKSTLRKNIGEKNCEITPEIRKQILEFYLAYTDADPLYSKVFDNKEFGYYSVEIQRPLRLRVDFTDEKLETLKESVKDDDLYELVQTFSKTAKDDIAMNFNEFMKQMESAANTAGS